jgi:hypothetical protein
MNMNITLITSIIAACLFAAVLLGMGIRRLLPENHLNADTKDTVKLAMGLVATMTALVLGLLVSSAKGAHDTTRSQVIQMAAKVTMIDRALSVYGPEATQARTDFHALVQEAVRQMWPGEGSEPAQLAPDTRVGNEVYFDIERLAPRNDLQRGLKDEVMTFAVQLGEIRALLLAQAMSSISKPFLIVVVAWLVLIFLSFSVLAPPNGTANIALMVSALSVAGAIFLILELDQPFHGVIQVSGQPLLNAVLHFAK